MNIKTKNDIKVLSEGGKILGQILSNLLKMSLAGVSTQTIDQAAEEMILSAGGKPSFKNYKGRATDRPFPATICSSLNHEIVHGIPNKQIKLKEGDIYTIDIGMEWPVNKKQRGLFTDTAATIAIGKVPKKTRQLLNVTAQALEEGINAIKPGVSVAEIGKAIEQYVKKQGKYGIIRDLSGHGVGYAVHEDPWIANYYDRRLEGYILKQGMVIALEPMITLGGWEIATAKDGWTIVTADKSLCAHFEHTVVVTETGYQVLTRRPEEL
jgi:methionyl aminopeptidase